MMTAIAPETTLRVRIGTVAATVVALTLARIAAAIFVEPVPDETYYWLWSRFPAFGYFDHPPMIAWWIRASTTLFGNGSLGLRALPVVSGVAVSALIWLTARELLPIRLRVDQEDGGSVASRAALWLQAAPLIGVGSFIATPDAPSVLFWSLTVWMLSRLRRTGEPTLWLWVGLFAGLGCVSKYTNLFLGIGIVAWLATDPAARRWFRSPWLYAGGAVALGVFTPTILHDAVNGWASFAKQFGRIPEGHVSLAYVGAFLGSQFALINPGIAILAASAVAGVRRPTHSSGPLVFLMLLTAPLVLYMAVHSLHANVQGNWPAPVYPSLALMAAIALEQAGHRRKTWQETAAHFVLAFGLAVTLATLTVLAIADRIAIPSKMPVDRIAGWSALADGVATRATALGASWIATTDYGTTGELAYHLDGRDRVISVAQRPRYAFTALNRSVVTTPGLLVTAHRDADRLYAACFASMRPAGTIDRQREGFPLERFWLFEVDGGKANLIDRGCDTEAQPVENNPSPASTR